MFSPRNLGFLLSIILALGIYFFFALHHLGEFETADEHYWIHDPAPGRIQGYWNAIAEKNWAKTYVNDKPGISLAFVSGIAILFGADTGNESKNFFEDYGYYRRYNPEHQAATNAAFRLPIVIWNAFASLVIFFLMWKLTADRFVALWSFIFILLSPTILGISRIVNPDSLLWSSVTIAILAFLVFLQEVKWRYALITGFSFGFALLSKYAATVLHPFLFFLTITTVVAKSALADPPDRPTIVKRLVSGYLIATAIGIAILAILLPAALVGERVAPNDQTNTPILLYNALGFWGMQYVFIGITPFSLALLADAHFFRSHFFSLSLKPADLLRKAVMPIVFLALFICSLAAIVNWLDIMPFDKKIQDIPLNTERGVSFKRLELHQKTIFEFVPILFSLPPIALILLLIAWAAAIFRKDTYRELVFKLSVYAVLFFASVVTISLLVTPRYGITLFPLFLIIAAIGLSWVASMKFLNRIPKIALTFLLLSTSVVPLFSARPYYFFYQNNLLPQKYVVNDAWGSSGYEAAQYLNSLPDAENLVVWADYNGFCPFFRGYCIKGSRGYKLNASAKNPLVIDYFVKTRRGSALYADTWRKVYDVHIRPDDEPVFAAYIDGNARNYIKVYQNSKEVFLPTISDSLETKNPASTE